MVYQRRYKSGKKTNRRKTRRVKRSRVKRSRVKRSRVKRTKMRGGLFKKIMGDPIKVGDIIISKSKLGTGEKYLLNMDGSKRKTADLGRYRVIGIEKRGKLGHRKKYLILDRNLKILEENAEKYVASPTPPPPPQIMKDLPEDSVTEYMKNFH